MIMFFSCGMCIISILSFLFLLIADWESGYFTVPMFFAMIWFLIASFLFYSKAKKYPLNDITEYYVQNFKQYFVLNGCEQSIYFEKKEGVWVCDNNKYQIKLDLRGYWFQKSYLKSYVIRNLRYPIISNKRSFLELFNNKCYIREVNTSLILIDGNKTEKISIIDKGITKYGFIAKEITIAPYAQWSSRSVIKYLKPKRYIDEREYNRKKRKCRHGL